jgi:CRISPR system Cascade subunit CasE
MIFLSKLSLDLGNPKLRSVLVNHYELHRTLLRAFPERLPESERVLYRMEISQQSGLQIPVLVQSCCEPDWDSLVKAGICQSPAQVKAYEPAFQAGQVLVFRLLGNPTMRLKQSRKRIGIYHKTGAADWLGRKARTGGFELLDVSINMQGMRTGIKYEKSKKNTLKHYGVLFEGKLIVSDSEIFRQTIYQGIGSGKAFGYGLLSVARADYN